MQRSLTLLAFTLAACSSTSSNATNGIDAASDAFSVDSTSDSGGEATSLPTCGAPPYVTYHVRVGEILVTGKTPPLPGALLTFDSCPELLVTTDAKGEAFASVQRSRAITAKISAPDHVTVMTAEQAATPVTTEIRNAEFLPRTDAGVIPGYDPFKPSFAVVIQPDASSAHCTTPVGITFQLTDHPEAHAFYTKDTWPTDTSPVVAGSSVGPVVFFTDIGPASKEVDGVKGASAVTSPCWVNGGALQTGRFLIEPGVWTVGNAQLSEPI